MKEFVAFTLKDSSSKKNPIKIVLPIDNITSIVDDEDHITTVWYQEDENLESVEIKESAAQAYQIIEDKRNQNLY